MTQEEKELLLKDLSARLPYRLLGKDCFGKTRQMVVIYDTGTILAHEIDGVCCSACGFVPYLRPMSSMTEEEKKEWVSLRTDVEKYYHIGHDAVVDFYNEHHFDYRGLIPIGLALEAPEGMYNS